MPLSLSVLRPARCFLQSVQIFTAAVRDTIVSRAISLYNFPMDNHQIAQLHTLLKTSQRIAFLGGAGLSTESGIPDFRSSRGIFQAIETYGYPPETLLSRSFFDAEPETFFDYYRKFLLYPEARPNAAHRVLAELERAGKLSAVITQNIDGLHQAAGSKRVLELHGSVHRNYCMQCGKFHDLAFVQASTGIPRCSCGGMVKPDVVLYEESLNEATLSAAIRTIRQADLLIVGGTSLQVYPAAGLVDYYMGNRLVLINLDRTRQDGAAALAIHEKIGQVLSSAWPEGMKD